MNCTRENCQCLVTEGKEYILNGKAYCNEACAYQFTDEKDEKDEKCVCTPCDCKKQ